MEFLNILKELRSDLFYQIESKHGAKKASKYPSIKKADVLIEKQKEFHSKESIDKSMVIVRNVIINFLEKMSINNNIDVNEILNDREIMNDYIDNYAKELSV